MVCKLSGCEGITWLLIGKFETNETIVSVLIGQSNETQLNLFLVIIYLDLV